MVAIPRSFLANFITDTYFVNATSYTFLQQFDNGGNPGNPIIEPPGVLIEDDFPTFVSTPRAVNQMYTEIVSKLNSGITFVGSWTMGHVSPQMVFYFGDTFANNGLAIRAAAAGDLNIELVLYGTGNILPIGVAGVVGTQNQIAFNYDPLDANVYASLNGGPVQSMASNAENFAGITIAYMNSNFGVGFPNGWIQYIGGYSIVPVGLLPSLSIPGNAPPDVINPVSTRKFATSNWIPTYYNAGLWR